jgi:lysophospholipase L1-like esterase
MERPALTRPGEFSIKAAADSRRGVFDMHNEALLAERLPVGVVFLGDSITDMWALDAFFRSPYGMVINRGIGGDRTEFARRRFDADVLQLQPRLLVMMIGINNCWDMNEWDPTRRRTAAEVETQVVEDTAAMLAMARAARLPVALCSILPTDMPFDRIAAERNACVQRMNVRLRELAAQHDAPYVDYHSKLVAPDGLTLRDGLADDGLHPHTIGYRIMAETLVTALTGAGIDSLARRG